MSATTKINWTDATWNPVTGCTPAGVGCAHCYAKRVAERFPAVHGIEPVHNWAVPFSTVICHPERLTIPEHWRKPRAIMCPSMGDLFHPDVPDGFIRDVLGVMDRCLQHTFIVLTKRQERAQEVLGDWTKIPNMVLGVSCSTQAEADHAIPILLNTPANRRIVSLEPLVGPVDLREVPGFNRIGLSLYNWGVIVGGESGPGARPMHPDWVRSLRDQCAAAGVPFFFKQWGEYSPMPEAGLGDATTYAFHKRYSHGRCSPELIRYAPPNGGAFVPAGDGFTDFNGISMYRVGRARAGRRIDGLTHDELCWDVAGKGGA